MTRPRVRVIRSGGRTYYGQDADHLHESIAQAADAARRESHGWLGPRSGIRAEGTSADQPMSVWAASEGWVL